MNETIDRPYADPTHPGNALRPGVRCHGCGALICTTAWGDWCFSCNVARLDRITAGLEQLCGVATNTRPPDLGWTPARWDNPYADLPFLAWVSPGRAWNLEVGEARGAVALVGLRRGAR